jgi:hypothetical protein
LARNLQRARNRCDGIEKSIPLPWRILADHFGGGLWPGFHTLNAATGLGKTQFGLQVGIGAAKQDIPVLYIGLELGEFDLVLRVLGELAIDVKWSDLFTGQAGKAMLQSAENAIPHATTLPFHYEVARPHGFAASAIRDSVALMRMLFPQGRLLVIVDFLQIVGDEPGECAELRIRIARAAYALRAAVNDFGATVLCISSIGRERIKLFTDIVTVAGLKWDVDENGRPTKRYIGSPDELVGAGKESGDIEYAADSVSVMARGGPWEEGRADIVFATAKGRATGAKWSPLRFSGFGFSECEDGGARMVDGWSEKREKKKQERAARQQEKENAAKTAASADAEDVYEYVRAHPGCGITEVTNAVLGKNQKRWKIASEQLGSRLKREDSGKSGAKIALTVMPGGEDDP